MSDDATYSLRGEMEDVLYAIRISINNADHDRYIQTIKESEKVRKRVMECVLIDVQEIADFCRRRDNIAIPKNWRIKDKTYIDQ